MPFGRSIINDLNIMTDADVTAKVTSLQEYIHCVGLVWNSCLKNGLDVILYRYFIHYATVFKRIEYFSFYRA